MRKINRESGMAFINFRLALIAVSKDRPTLRRLAQVAREDLDLLLELHIISHEESIQLECGLSIAVQKRLQELQGERPRLLLITCKEPA